MKKGRESGEFAVDMESDMNIASLQVHEVGKITMGSADMPERSCLDVVEEKMKERNIGPH